MVLEVEFCGGGGSGSGRREGGVEHFDRDGDEGLFVVVAAGFAGGGLGGVRVVAEAPTVVVGVVAHVCLVFDELRDSAV